MSVPKSIRLFVRQRAGFACEYCSVREQDSGGELTLDHFQPTHHDGKDDLDNLVYCCHRCNTYKGDYFPITPEQPSIWNPRHGTFQTHFLSMADGTLEALTPIGAFTIRLLRLNRPPLIQYRRSQQMQNESAELLRQLLEISTTLQRTILSVNQLSEYQQKLLEAQMQLLQLLTQRK